MLDANMTYRHIPSYTYRQLHSFSSHLNATKNQLAFFAPPAFINPFMVPFQLGFFLLLCMSQKYFCFRCSNVTKEKKMQWWLPHVNYFGFRSFDHGCTTRLRTCSGRHGFALCRPTFFLPADAYTLSCELEPTKRV